MHSLPLQRKKTLPWPGNKRQEILPPSGTRTVWIFVFQRFGILREKM